MQIRLWLPEHNFKEAFHCSFCGERIFSHDHLYLIQNIHGTEIRHEECLEENLK